MTVLDDVIRDFDDGGVELVTRRFRVYLEVVHIEEVADAPVAMAAYSQRDPRWRDEVYAGGLTIGQAGCYVTCVAMVASCAGYVDTPPQVALKLREAGCFSGALLANPHFIPNAYPALAWAGALDWRNRPANLVRLRAELERGPAIVEVEFWPGGAVPPQDQHFVVAQSLTDNGDLVIIDPWDGAEVRLLARYAQEHWDLARAVYGLRLLRVV